MEQQSREQPPFADLSALATPALKGRTINDSIEESSASEAEKTLDSIIGSADEASVRIRRVLEQSRLDRSVRQSLSPPSSSRNMDDQTLESSVDEEGGETTGNAVRELSVWGEKSFFRRMARKAPGGWAFTPQPKLRAVTEVEEGNEEKEEMGENVEGNVGKEDRKVRFVLIVLILGVCD
jgi:hypothetical protein